MKKRLKKKLQKLGKLPWLETLPDGSFIYHCVKDCEICQTERDIYEHPFTQSDIDEVEKMVNNIPSE